MTFRHLLVHLDKSDASAVRADVAAVLAKRFGARLTAVYAVRDPEVPSVGSRNRYVFVERAAGKAEAAFRLHVANAGVEAEWQADVGSTDLQVSRAVVLRSREVDLIVLGQFEPDEADSGAPESLIEHTVLHSGRPVLVVPYAGRFPEIGKRAVIAWNGSREAARAVHDALPLLQGADQVIVLALAPAGKGGAGEAQPTPPESMVRHLAEHEVKATGDVLVFDPASIEPAERLLSYLADAGADLLVLGAAGQQQGRAAAKRSLTGRVLAQMTAPVLLSY